MLRGGGIVAWVSYAPRMWLGRTAFFAVAVGLASACGGATGYEPQSDATGGTSGSVDAGLGTGGGGLPNPVDGGHPTDGYVDVHSEYVPPVCPDAVAPPPEEECDLFAPATGCPAGLGCFPYVEYPAPGDDCAQERFGTECLLTGSGLQGEPCEAGDCAAHHLCVLTGEGTICVELCSTLGGDTCPPGLLCEPIDVQPGVGGCY